MVIDDELALVKSLNWETKNLTETRDYAVVTGHRHEVEEVVACFEADWHRKHFEPDPHAHLIWCPLNGRDRIAEFIDRAKHTLFVQNERYQDQVIIERLVRAAARGVKIHLMARPPHTLKKDKLVEGVGGLRILDDVGVKVHKLKRLKLHAKMLLADGERAIVGLDQPRARQLRQPARARDRGRRRRRRQGAAQDRAARLGELAHARPHRRGAARGSREARRRGGGEARAQGEGEEPRRRPRPRRRVRTKPKTKAKGPSRRPSRRPRPTRRPGRRPRKRFERCASEAAVDRRRTAPPARPVPARTPDAAG